ncbi:hypothetical protein HU200_040052 [Digitaria exilis]|uniref:Uncharacterized protein n=1 Tax=Digitaria exilis TaxID=1010633 RepID=A0A835B6H9_9POAL|nr:hypothetical protein HU200_040052 [Digitaria exilis]
MAPIILQRALSFSNLPVHRYDVSPLKVSISVSNGNEGLALLTTIAEGTDDCCIPSPLLSNRSPLEKNLISKIIHLREVLDLPLQSSSDALDQLLLGTLEALKIAYPKCISGQSGTIYSVQQGLVHLHKVLMSVQDCYAERYQLSNLGSGKQPIIVSESLEHVGEGVIEMIDQVIPVAKEMFNFMESSRSANAAASAAWLEDLPGRRSLPPVLCHIRSPEHFKGAGPHASDSAEVATPCQDGAIRHTEQLKVQKHVPRQESGGGSFTAEDDQTSRSQPPSTPNGDSLLLQLTPSSVSPHPLSAPPPSPVPLLGLPMLLQSWEAMQDDKATAATVTPSVSMEEDTAVVTGSKDNSAVSVSMKAGQPSSPSSTVGNATMPSVPQPLPPPSLVQEGLPAKVSRAPPPPPPGNISAALRAKKAACKLKRSTKMGTLYRHLRDRLEGSGCTHGGKAQAKNKTPGGHKSNAGLGMADALAEMTKRYWRANATLNSRSVDHFLVTEINVYHVLLLLETWNWNG